LSIFLRVIEVEEVLPFLYETFLLLLLVLEFEKGGGGKRCFCCCCLFSKRFGLMTKKYTRMHTTTTRIITPGMTVPSMMPNLAPRDKSFLFFC
jgi:hypothetical protein